MVRDQSSELSQGVAEAMYKVLRQHTLQLPTLAEVLETEERLRGQDALEAAHVRKAKGWLARGVDWLKCGLGRGGKATA